MKGKTLSEGGEHKICLLFLCYMPRSGSTLLGSRLANYSDEVCVLPETKSLERILNSGLYDATKDKFSGDSKNLWRILSGDHRFINLGFDQSHSVELWRAISMGLENFLLHVCFKFAELNHIGVAKVFVIKNGTTPFNRGIFRQKIFSSNVKFLYIRRDARAIVSSMLKRKYAVTDKAVQLVDSYSLAVRALVIVQ